MSMFDVITIGSATRDVFLRSSAWEVREDAESPTGLEQCLPLGAKVPVDEIHLTTGGGATNAAATFARLGKLRTACVCRIGRDRDGEEIVHELQRDRVATILVQRDPNVHTSHSTILLSGSGERTILTYRGVSARISSRAIPWARLRSRWFYVTSLAGNLALFKKILRHAERIGARVAWNPGNAELEHGRDALAPLLARTAVFNVNREEAVQLTGVPSNDISGVLRSLSSPHPSLLTSHPFRVVLLTDGANGAYATDGTSIWHIASRNIPTVNTTGAGDAFGSGFVTGLIRDMDIPAAFRLAMANAEGVITHMGAKTGILSRMPSPRALALYSVERIAG